MLGPTGDAASAAGSVSTEVPSQVPNPAKDPALFHCTELTGEPGVPPPPEPQAPVEVATRLAAVSPRQLTWVPVVTPENVNVELKVCAAENVCARFSSATIPVF